MKYTWKQFDEDTKKIAKWIKKNNFKSIYGIPRGGLILAVKLSHLCNLILILNENQIDTNTVIVDDISDTGKTLSNFSVLNYTATIFIHKQTICMPNFYLREKKKSWIIFSWEI